MITFYQRTNGAYGQRAASWLATACLALVAGACVDIDDRPATWSYVHATIIGPSCATAGCHSDLAATAGLMLHTRESAYTYLVGRVCGQSLPDEEAPHNFVVPHDPERSKLMYLLRGVEVRMMPPDLPLPEAEIALVERWILEGAPCD